MSGLGGNDAVLTILRRVLSREVVFGVGEEEANRECGGQGSENGGCGDQCDFSRIHRRVSDESAPSFAALSQNLHC